MAIRAFLALAMMAAIQGPPPTIPESARARGYSGSGSQIVSPTVVATWMTWAQGRSDTLDLLVLWRGKPGWFLEGDGHRSSGGGTRDVWSATIEYSGRPLTVVLDRKRRLVTIERRKVDLKPGDNVVLVDGVDRADRVLVISTAHVDPRLQPQQPPIPIVLRRSDQLLEFLQCDLTVPQASAQRTIDRLCEQVGRRR